MSLLRRAPKPRLCRGLPTTVRFTPQKTGMIIHCARLAGHLMIHHAAACSLALSVHSGQKTRGSISLLHRTSLLDREVPVCFLLPLIRPYHRFHLCYLDLGLPPASRPRAPLASTGSPSLPPSLQDTLASLLACLDSLESIQCSSGRKIRIRLRLHLPCHVGRPGLHVTDPTRLYSPSLPQHDRLTPRVSEPSIYTALGARLYTW